MKLNFKSSPMTSGLSVSHIFIHRLQMNKWNICSLNTLSLLHPAGAQLPLRGMYL